MPRSGQTIVPQDFFGFVHAGNSGTAEEYQLLDEMGAVWLLNTFYWGSIENEKGVFDFSWYDDFVNTAKENGKKVIAVMAYETPWLFPEGRGKRYISSENIPHFLNFLEVTVDRYRGKVDAWQIWNEPNWIFWRGSDRDFFELTRLSAIRIRETDPDAYIIGGAFWRTPKGFIRGMHRAGAMENLDALSFHPYATNPRGAMRLFDDFLKIISEINFSGDIWITEVGFPTSGWYPSSVSMENLPSYVIKTIVGSAARGARTLLWYSLGDSYNLGEAPDKNDSEAFFGLTYPDFTRKNGAWAYELCARFLPGSRFMPELPQRINIPSNIVSFCFLEGIAGKNTLVIWNDRNNTQRIQLTLDSPVTIHEISTGNSVIKQDEIILDITNVPVFITWEGSASPVISGNIK
jgi:hypothetical protein